MTRNRNGSTATTKCREMLISRNDTKNGRKDGKNGRKSKVEEESTSRRFTIEIGVKIVFPFSCIESGSWSLKRMSMQLRAKSKKGGFAWVNRKIFERLASKEEERKSKSYFNRNCGVTGVIAGAGIAGYPVVKNEIDRANHLNAVNKREYLDAKDRSIRYWYSQAQSNAIRGQMDGMNEELGLTADKKNWTQCQRELREGYANKIRSASLHRRDAYFHLSEQDFISEAVANNSRKM